MAKRRHRRAKLTWKNRKANHGKKPGYGTSKKSMKNR